MHSSKTILSSIYINVHVLCLILFVLWTNMGFAQPARLNQANKYYDEYAFHKAIESYEKVENKDVLTLRKLARSYRNTGDYYNAENVYMQIVASDEAQDEDYYNYAMLLRMNSKYKESEDWMEKYISNHLEDKRGQEFRDKEAEIIEMMKEMTYSVSNLSWNSMHQDFGVLKYKDGVCFVSSNTGPKMVARNYNWNQLPFLDVMKADVNGDQELINVERLDLPVNSKYHEGRAALNDAADYVVFSRNIEQKGGDDLVRVHLFSIKMEEGKWTKAKPISFCKSDYSYSNPYLTADGRTLYFSSNLKDGMGGADIYKSTRNEDDNWSEPVNLGSNVNTEGNEVYPYLDENGSLYFSSDGHVGIGGLDIFQSSFENGSFGEAMNVGVPLNSRADDFGFIHFPDQKHGFFSSNREDGNGNDDLFSFIKQEPIEFRNFRVDGNVLNSENKPYADLNIEIVDENGDIMEPVLDSIRTDEFGNYRFEIADQKDLEDIDITDQYWIVVKYKDFYDSQNPEVIDEEKGLYERDFLVDADPDVVLQLDIQDQLTQVEMKDVIITMIDNETSAKKIFVPDSSKMRIGFPGKHEGDNIDVEFRIEKSGYETKSFSYEAKVDSEDTYELKEAIEQKVFQDIVFTGLCKTSEDSILRGISVDLMNGDMDIEQQVKTDENGVYFITKSVEINAEKPLNIESDYWLLSRNDSKYESQKPNSDLDDQYKFVTNFIFEKPAEVQFELNLADAKTKTPLPLAGVVLIDHHSSSKREIRVEQGTYSFNLNGKRIGESVSYKIQIESEGYRSKTIDFETTIGETGKLVLNETLEPRTFQTIRLFGVVKTPQGDRLRGVKVDLVDDEMVFLKSVKTNFEGEFDFITKMETEPGQSINIEDKFWMLAKYHEFYDSQNPIKKGDGDTLTYYNEFIFEEIPELAINLDISEETKDIALDKVKITVTDNVNHTSRVIIPERSNLKIGLSDKNVGDSVNYSIVFEKEGFENKAVEYKQQLDTAGVYVIKERIEKKNFQDVLFIGMAQNDKGDKLGNVIIDVMDENANFVNKIITDEEGSFELPMRVKYNDGVPPNIEQDYWFVAQHNNFYDSKTPVKDLSTPHLYHANFQFKENVAIQLNLTVSDSISGILIKDFKVALIDQESGLKQKISVKEDVLILNLKDKQIGDRLNYQFKVEKEGYESILFSHVQGIDKEGIIEVNKKLVKLNDRLVRISGICKNNKGESLSGVVVDLMDPMMDIVGSKTSDSKGNYEFSFKMKEDDLAEYEVESDYVLLANHQNNYNSQNPIQLVKTESNEHAITKTLEFKANFVFREGVANELEVNLTDQETSELLNNVTLTLVDQFTSRDKVLTVQNGHIKYPLADKKVGDSIRFTLHLEKDRYQAKDVIFSAIIKDKEKLIINETLSRKIFKEYSFSGLVRSPQGDRLKDVKIELVDEKGEGIGTVSTNKEGKFKLNSILEINPGKPRPVETDYWVLAKYKEFYDSKNPGVISSDPYSFYNEFIFDEEPKFSFNLDISDQTKDVPLDKVRITVTDNITHESKVIIPERSNLKIGLNEKSLGDSADYHITFEKEGYDKKEIDFKQQLDTAGVYVIRETIEKKKYEDLVVHGIAQDNLGNRLSNVSVDIIDGDFSIIKTGLTDENGAYRFEVSLDLTEGSSIRFEDDYWLIAKSGALFDSKNPVKDLNKEGSYQANFVFRKAEEITLSISAYDVDSKEALMAFSVALIDESMNEKRVFRADLGSVGIPIPEAKKGDFGSFHIEIWKEGYEKLSFPYAVNFERDGLYKINRGMVRLKASDSSVTETPPKVLEFDLNTVYFEFDSYRLTKQAVLVLERNRDEMHKYESVVLW